MKYLKMVTSFLLMGMMLACMGGCSLLTDVLSADGIVISEVMTSNGGTLHAGGLGSPDWIELFNDGEQEINLQGYTLVRVDSAEKRFVFPDVVIGAGEYLVVCAADAPVDGEYAWICTGFNLPKKGTGLKIKDASGNTVCTLSVPALSTDVSYCRVDGKYRFCSTPTPGEVNGGIFADTMEELEFLPAPEGLQISEACAQWVELFNASQKEIDLSQFCLSEDASRCNKWGLPADALQPGEYYLIHLDGRGDICANFVISEEEQDLFLCFNGGIYDQVHIGGLWDGMSVGRDAEGELAYFSQQTPGEQNTKPAAYSLDIAKEEGQQSLVITELLLDNQTGRIDEDGDRPDWVELYNQTDEAVSLGGYYLSDEEAMPAKWQLPDAELAPGEYVLIYLSGKDRDYHTNFKVGAGEPLVLADLKAQTMQVVLVPDESRFPDVSYGSKNGVWGYFGSATPGRENVTASSATIAAVQAIDQHGVYISEVSASFAPRSDGKDWIELYNGGGEAVSLEGWHLGTDIDAPDACPLSGTIEPGGYRVFYASNNVAKQDAQTLGLGIAQSGEQIVLSNGYGEVADLFETGALKLGYTSGRVEGGKGERAFFDTPTLGEKNASPVDRQLNAPEFSLPGGYYAGQQALAITAEEGCSIYYTLDGSTPTAQSAPYTQPLALTETTVVKAIAAKDGYIVSDPAVATYLFVEPHVIPVVSLTMDEADFRAICASTTKENIVERACNVEYYENDGTLGTSFPAGIRISGNSTRNYPQKSFSLYLRSGYGKSSVVYPFFENYELTQYNTLLLRNAGQNISYARMMDAYASALFSDMRMDSAKSKFVVVYVNGRYYGILDLKENLNEDGLAYKNDVDVQEVTVIRRNIHALSGSNAQVKQVYDYAKSWNMADDVQYEKFCEFVDADAWIDYIIARSYTGDYDIFNQKLWNTSSYSVKWRPIFYDCDFAFAGLSACTLDKYFTYDGVPSQDGSFTNMYIPTALKKNSGWRDAFVKRYAEVMVDLPARSLALFDEMYGQLSAEMERHIARWGKPSSYEQWNRYAQNLRYILEKRPQVVINQVERVFQVPQEQMRELFPDYE